MYNKTKPNKTNLKVNTSYEGETIEQKVNRIVNNKEPIKDGAPIIYTERKDGVLPEYDIRTDRFEHAVEMTDKIAKDHLAKRAEGIKSRSIGEQAKEGMKNEQKDGGAEPVQTTTPQA